MHATCDWLPDCREHDLPNQLCNVCTVRFLEAEPKRFPRHVTVELPSGGCHCLLD